VWANLVLVRTPFLVSVVGFYGFPNLLLSSVSVESSFVKGGTINQELIKRRVLQTEGRLHSKHFKIKVWILKEGQRKG